MKHLLKHFKELTVRPKNAQELKGLILQFAVQGNLTSQWRNKNQVLEPASVLLEKIKKVKEQLVKEKKLKKDKTLPLIKEDEIPFSIPSNWEWTKMIDSIHLVTKGATPTSYGFQFQESGINFIKIESVKEGEIKHNLIDCFISEAAHQNQKRSILQEGDLLFSIAGTIGATAIVKPSDLPANTNQALAIIRGSNQVYNPKYLQFLLDSFVTKTTREKARGAAMNNISLGDIKEMLVPLPPLEEQKEIVKVVEILFKEVEQLEQLTVERITLKENFVTSTLNQLTTNNAKSEWAFLQENFRSFFNETSNIKKLRETVLQLAVQGKLTADWRSRHPELVEGKHHASQLLKRIQKEKAQLIKDKKIKKEKPLPPITIDKIPYELPEGWDFVRLGSIIKISSGDGLTSANMDKSGKIPVYGGNGITGYHSEYNVEKPEIVIGRVGYYCGSIHLSEDKAWVTDNAFVTRFSETNIYRDFLVWLLKGTNLKEDENATAQPVISGRKIYPIIVSLPPLEEQKVIVQKVNALMGLCDALEQEVQQSQEQSEQLMQSCLREVFEGEKAEVISH